MIASLITTGISIAAFLVLLAIIVFIHEYGHFKTARLCGIRVDTFSIGFGPAFLKWTDKKGTVWKIASIPLGGYVKFFGDANAASAGASAGEEDGERPITTQFNSEKDRLAALLTEEEKKVCFHFKPVWQRMAVVAAGPFANFILGAVIFAGMFMLIGTRDVEPRVGYVTEGSAAAEAGFEPGDLITKLNGRPLRDFRKLQQRVALSAETDVLFTINRDGREIELIAAPRRTEIVDAFGNPARAGRIGVELYTEPRIGKFDDNSPEEAAGLAVGDVILKIDGKDVFTAGDIWRIIRNRPNEKAIFMIDRDGAQRSYEVLISADEIVAEDGSIQLRGGLKAAFYQEPLRKLSLPVALISGGDEVREIISNTLRFLGRLVTFREDPRQVGGPITMAKFSGQAAQAGFAPQFADQSLGTKLLISLQYFINLAAVISVSIGLMNILPIPVLDGGHLVYYAYEAIAGRPLSDRVQGIGFRIGLAVVGTFMIFVIVNDFTKLF